MTALSMPRALNTLWLSQWRTARAVAPTSATARAVLMMRARCVSRLGLPKGDAGRPPGDP
jgi:hypothetical protein